MHDARTRAVDSVRYSPPLVARVEMKKSTFGQIAAACTRTYGIPVEIGAENAHVNNGGYCEVEMTRRRAFREHLIGLLHSTANVVEYGRFDVQLSVAVGRHPLNIYVNDHELQLHWTILLLCPTSPDLELIN